MRAAAVERRLNRLLEASEEIVRNPGAARPIADAFPDWDPSEPPAEVVEGALDEAERLDAENAQLAYVLVRLVARWSRNAPLEANLRFRLFHTLGNYATRAADVETVLDARELSIVAAEEAGMAAAVAAELTNLGNALRRAGRVREAADVYERAIAATGGDIPAATRAYVFLNAATAFSDLQEYDRAAALAGEAVALSRDDPEQRRALLFALTNLSGSSYAAGRYSEAEEANLEALELARAEGIRSQEGVALGHLGLIAFKRGEVSHALELLTAAAEIAEEEGDLWNAQHWHRDLAGYWAELGYSERAVDSYSRALELSRMRRDARSEALCLLGIGDNLIDSDAEEGLGYLQAAVSAFAVIGDDARALEGALRCATACMAEALGIRHHIETMFADVAAMPGAKLDVIDEQALAAARGWIGFAEELAEQQVTSPVLLMRTRASLYRIDGRPDAALAELKSAFARAHGLLDTARVEAELGSVHARDLDRPREALAHYEAAIAAREEAVAHADVHEFRVDLRDRLAPIYLSAIDAAVRAGAEDAAFSLCERAKFGAARRLLAQRRDEDGAIHSREALARAVARHGRVAVAEFLPAFGRTFVFLFAPGLVDADGLVVVEGVDVSSIARDWWVPLYDAYDAVVAGGSADSAALERWRGRLRQVCAERGGRLLAPVAERLDDLVFDEVVFVPYSMLHSFPLHACPLEGSTSWIDRYAVSYAPTASLLVDLWAHETRGERAFLGVGDPTGDLPLAGLEIELAARRLRVDGARLLIGSDATRANVMPEIGRAGWIHFAGHALHVVGDSFASGLMLAPEGPDGNGELLDLVSLNREVRLPRDSTIVLSACESGMLTPGLADEMVSLAGGFVTAGARTVVSTYWQVTDACAALTLDRFYGELAGGRSVGAALRSAVLAVRDLGEDAAYIRLAELLGEPGFDGGLRRDVLAEFEYRRPDARPFGELSEWASFSVTGGAGARWR